MIKLNLLIVIALIGLIGCKANTNNNNNELKPITETQNFAYVNTLNTALDYAFYREHPDREYPDYDITMLNQWLRANPNKKVVSFSGVLAYREGVSGYVVFFTLGDNSRQKFERRC